MSDALNVAQIETQRYLVGDFETSPTTWWSTKLRFDVRKVQRQLCLAQSKNEFEWKPTKNNNHTALMVSDCSFCAAGRARPSFSIFSREKTILDRSTSVSSVFEISASDKRSTASVPITIKNRNFGKYKDEMTHCQIDFQPNWEIEWMRFERVLHWFWQLTE